MTGGDMTGGDLADGDRPATDPAIIRALHALDALFQRVQAAYVARLAREMAEETDRAVARPPGGSSPS